MAESQPTPKDQGDNIEDTVQGASQSDYNLASIMNDGFGTYYRFDSLFEKHWEELSFYAKKYNEVDAVAIFAETLSLAKRIGSEQDEIYTSDYLREGLGENELLKRVEELMEGFAVLVLPHRKKENIPLWEKIGSYYKNTLHDGEQVALTEKYKTLFDIADELVIVPNLDYVQNIGSPLALQAETKLREELAPYFGTEPDKLHTLMFYQMLQKAVRENPAYHVDVSAESIPLIYGTPPLDKPKQFFGNLRSMASRFGKFIGLTK